MGTHARADLHLLTTRVPQQIRPGCFSSLPYPTTGHGEKAAVAFGLDQPAPLRINHAHALVRAQHNGWGLFLRITRGVPLDTARGWQLHPALSGSQCVVRMFAAAVFAADIGRKNRQRARGLGCRILLIRRQPDSLQPLELATHAGAQQRLALTVEELGIVLETQQRHIRSRAQALHLTGARPVAPLGTLHPMLAIAGVDHTPAPRVRNQCTRRVVTIFWAVQRGQTFSTRTKQQDFAAGTALGDKKTALTPDFCVGRRQQLACGTDQEILASTASHRRRRRPSDGLSMASAPRPGRLNNCFGLGLAHANTHAIFKIAQTAELRRLQPATAFVHQTFAPLILKDRDDSRLGRNRILETLLPCQGQQLALLADGARRHLQIGQPALRLRTALGDMHPRVGRQAGRRLGQSQELAALCDKSLRAFAGLDQRPVTHKGLRAVKACRHGSSPLAVDKPHVDPALDGPGHDSQPLGKRRGIMELRRYGPLSLSVDKAPAPIIVLLATTILALAGLDLQNRRQPLRESPGLLELRRNLHPALTVHIAP